MSDDYTVDEKGNISGSFTIRLNGQDYDVPINTSIDRMVQQKKNSEDPDSREKEIIESDEVVLPFKSFFNDFVLRSVGLEGDISRRMFAININARAEGYNNVIIKKEDYNRILKNKGKE